MAQTNYGTVGKIILVGSLSAKGKQRIKDWGSSWKVVDVGQRGLLIQAVTDMTGASKRWLDQPEDSDFRIILEQ